MSKQSSRMQSTQRNQEALKNIVDPFLQWYNELFNSQDCLKKVGNAEIQTEDSLPNDNGFEVNEETLFNILSADMQGSSKIQSFNTFQVLPTIPASIAERTNLQQKMYSYKLNECYKAREDKRGTVTRIKYDDLTDGINLDAYLTSTDFVDTRHLCEKLKDLTIIRNFFNNPDEYSNYAAAYEHF